MTVIMKTTKNKRLLVMNYVLSLHLSNNTVVFLRISSVIKTRNQSDGKKNIQVRKFSDMAGKKKKPAKTSRAAAAEGSGDAAICWQVSLVPVAERHLCLSNLLHTALSR